MRKYTCIILEDEPLARNLMEAYVSKLTQIELVKSFGRSMAALDYLRENEVDLLFSDIQMPEITGISLLKLLKNKPLVILTTAYSEYALEGYELEVFDYLLKPISFERFLKATEKAIIRLDEIQAAKGNIPSAIVVTEQAPLPESQIIFVKDGTKLVKVRLNEILYIESLKDYVCIYTTTQKIVSLQTMKSLEANLSSSQFIRIHNSFIIAFDAIDSIEKDRIVIKKTTIPISDSYKKAFKEFVDSKKLGI